MSRVKLGDVAVESLETCKGNKAGLPIVGLEHITPGEITLSNWDIDTDNTFTKRFRKGDMLFGRRRAYLKKAAQAPFDGLCSGDITVIRAKDEILLPELLPFIIQNDNLFDFAVGKSAGSLSPRVKWESLKNYAFDLPSMEEQTKLSEVLWAINDTLQAYQKLLVETDALVQAQFVEMFGEEDDIEHCRWPVDFMENIFFISSSKRILKSEWKTEGSIPFIRVRDMVQLANGEPLANEFFVSESFYNSRPKEDQVKAGDIIVSATSTIGKTYVIKQGERFYFKDADVLLFRKKIPINETFFTYGLTMPMMWSQIEGGLGATTVAHFLISKACKLKQPLPPLHLQETFEALVTEGNKAKSSLQTAITSLQATKRCILNDALGTNRKE